MNQMSQLNWEGKDLVFISCEDFRNYISCSSLDLIIVFAVCHDEEVKGLGVRRGNPAHRSFPQDPWLACTAAVHWDQAQTFIFPSLQQASRQIRCTMCQYIGGRFILPHYPTLLQLASRAVPALHWEGEATRVSWCFHLLQTCLQLKGQNDIIMLVSERNCSETVQQHEAMRRHGLSVLLPPHNGLATFSVLMRQPRKSTQTSVSEDLSHQVTTH